MTAADLVAQVMLVSLILYVLLGGADFGGGFWDFLASGPRKEAQRKLVDKAIAPVWEANHVWLILVIVLLFTCFPGAFYPIMIALHVPLTLLLLGIVLRGAAFIFRHYGAFDSGDTRAWGRLFALTSSLTPIFLGIVVGSITMGEMTATSWLGLFPVAVGFFTLSLFAFLAAVYLTNETEDPQLRDDFRSRALYSSVAVAVAAVGVAILGEGAAAHFRDRFLGTTWGLAVQAATFVSAATCFWALYSRRFRLARVAAVTQVTGILLGWGVSQYPYFLPPHVTIQGAASPAATLRLILIALACGSVVLFPSLFWLMKVFKSRPAD